MPRAALLSVQGLTVRYGERVAVDALCLEVAAGEALGLLGPNGSGKSSTLAAITGALTPAAGLITVGGLRLAAAPLAYRRLLGIVPQELAFYEELTGEENLLFFGRLYGLTGRDLRRRAAEALAVVLLTADARRLARAYSGGMQRRLNLACALLHRPALLLLDEPTVGLDATSRDAVLDGLRRLRDDGRGLVFASHHLAEAAALCDRVGVMDRGRLVALGTPADLLDDEAPAERGLERLFLQLTGGPHAP
jgi:ABC-2 type transport system ATP-binding protein